MSSSVRVRDTQTARFGDRPVRIGPRFSKFWGLVRESLVRVFQTSWRAWSSLFDVPFDIPVVLLWMILSDWTANEKTEIWNLSWVYLQRTSDHMQQFWLEEWAWFQLPKKNSLLVARLNYNYSLIHITSDLFRFSLGRFIIFIFRGLK